MKAVSSEFLPQFEATLTSTINTVATKSINTISTTFPIPSLKVEIMLNTVFSEVNNNLVFASAGEIVPGNPPFFWLMPKAPTHPSSV